MGFASILGKITFGHWELGAVGGAASTPPASAKVALYYYLMAGIGNV